LRAMFFPAPTTRLSIKEYPISAVIPDMAMENALI